MPSYTTSLRLIQPSTGEYPGDWGNQVNSSLTAVVDKAVAGTATITMTAANYTLTNANGVADEAKSMFLVLQGTPGASYFVIVPTASKLYFVTNNTGFAQSVSTSASGGVSVPNGASIVLRCDGTNVVEALNSLGSIVLNGGTANGVAYLNASKALTTGSALVFDGTNFSTTGTATATKLIPTGGSATGNGMYLPAANTLAWSNNGAETMRLDSSGNLGLGVTPGYAYSGWKLLQCSRDVTFGGVAGGPVYGFMAVNAYPDITTDPTTATWGYRLTGSLASRYDQLAGAHRWFTAPSGTAGTAISFTQAMTLDANGNLLVGQTSGSDAIEATRSGSTSCGIVLNQTGTSGRKYVIASTGSGYGAGNLIFYDYTASAERARITSGGDLLVGTTDAAATATTNGLICDGTNPGFVVSRRSTGAAQTHLEFRNGGTNVGNITSSTTTTTYATTSDRRLKDNIVPAPSASAVIDAIEIVSHDWKAAPDKHVTYGVIAQDLALVAPQAVLQGDDGDEIEKTWGVDYSKLVPMLIKEIQSLRARVAALEQA